MSDGANPKHEIAAPGKVADGLAFLEGAEHEIYYIARALKDTDTFRNVSLERIEQLVREWFDTGHWWEPDELDLILFLEGEL